MKALVLSFFLFTLNYLNAQQNVKAVIADSLTKQPLPFATVQAAGESKSVISSIDGKFSLSLTQAGAILISYSGYRSKTIFSSELSKNDTVFLAPLTATMEEVIIRSPLDKIKRIVNTAIQNKSLHNPDQYTYYACNIYYKMIADIKEYGGYNMDSIQKRQDSLRNLRTTKRKRKDSAATDTVRPFRFAVPSHLFMTETYSKRLYKKPAITQEVVLASKVSGLSKTYFASFITDVLPFHVYTDYINLNSIDFINPIAKGWQGRYRFLLENEIIINNDTVFILSYAPKAGTSFNSLTGLVYINSSGYAITHFTGTNADNSANNRFVKFEHIYKQINGKWFPHELNYDFGIRKVPAPYTQIVWNGHSVIDSVLFDRTTAYKFDKAHPVKLSDSVDLHEEGDWQRFRKDTLSAAEANTYKNMDSLMRKTPMESLILFSARLATGRFPIGKTDVDADRIFAANQYEGIRLGLGLYTNNKISKYYSVGGWFGYGFKDKVAKYGGSLTLFPKGDKENWLSFSYQKNYKLTGEVNLHPELSSNSLRNWLLQQVDEIKEYAVTANLKPGYWELRPSFARTEITPLHYTFQANGKHIRSFTTHEASIGLRYAYGEKRVPFFEYYLSSGTKYPIVYAGLSRGRISSAGYGAVYSRALAAIHFQKHINRWGQDRFQLEAGIVKVEDDQPLPRSLLMAGNGFKRGDVNFYLWGGFLTMQPFDFYSDRYISLLYRHQFDKNFWNLKWSKPFLSLAHNMIYGSVNHLSKQANAGLQSYDNGYHESGLLLNRILKYNLGFADAHLNAGAFYHWQSNGSWTQNGVWVIGLSAGF